jgi:hypothetical protein
MRAWWAALSRVSSRSSPLAVGEPSSHGWVGGVSRDVHVDLTMAKPELMVRVTTVRGSPRVAKAVQHVPEQGGKAGTVQFVATE